MPGTALVELEPGGGVSSVCSALTEPQGLILHTPQKHCLLIRLIKHQLSTIFVVGYHKHMEDPSRKRKFIHGPYPYGGYTPIKNDSKAIKADERTMVCIILFIFKILG